MRYRYSSSSERGLLCCAGPVLGLRRLLRLLAVVLVVIMGLVWLLTPATRTTIFKIPHGVE